LPGAATIAPASGRARSIAAELDAAAAGQHDKSGKYPQLAIVFAVGRDGPSLDDKRGSDREPLRQTVKLVMYRQWHRPLSA
jgi:hypothetical protein